MAEFLFEAGIWVGFVLFMFLIGLMFWEQEKTIQAQKECNRIDSEMYGGEPKKRKKGK